jgi:hypothetical protein
MFVVVPAVAFRIFERRRVFRGSDVGKCPLNRRIIGLVSLLQRCRRARASADTLGSRHEPTPMQTTLVLRRTMRVTSPSTHSHSFLDLTGPDRRPSYAQYGHSRHIMGLCPQQAR